MIRRASVASGVEHLIQNVALYAVGLISAAHQAILRLFLPQDGLLPQTTAILIRVKFTRRIGR